MWRYLAVVPVIFVVDQATKWAAVKYLARHAEVPLVPFVNLTLVFNTGAAFGFLSSASGWQNLLFIGVAIAACAVILWMLYRYGAEDALFATALVLILGGALGNLCDRFLYGHVIDFVDVYYGSWHWPAFNVADSAITIGAMLLIFDSARFRHGRRGGTCDRGK